MNVYKQVTQWEFEVECTRLAIVDWRLDVDPKVWIEELDKNGQEDTHMQGVLEYHDGEWWWTEGREGFVMYESEALANAIPMFLKDNPFPEEMS